MRTRSEERVLRGERMKTARTRSEERVLRNEDEDHEDHEYKVRRTSVEGREDDESRVLKEKMAEMLSDEFVTVEPRKHSILKHLRLLVESVRRHNLVGTRWHKKNCGHFVVQVGPKVRPLRLLISLKSS